VVCLTDLYTASPDSIPTVPVLGAITGDNTSQPPFGERISIN
jgi:hypothetical protein